MPAGDAFTSDQRRRIDRARLTAARTSGLDFHVYLGPLGDDARAQALQLHGARPDAVRVVLVAVDPRAHALEIVTGAEARRVLDDAACGLAALTMQSHFASGDLVSGLVRGLHQLGDHARSPSTLHAQPLTAHT